MKLKRLILQGYKTFASKTEFVFDDGLTAVVGPNGSGKSNVADALRWVLGEQSYGTLRGKRSTDMIFAGSQSRARAGMAQVSLTLDNSDGWLPLDYAEVEIIRRVHRSGESDYLLNGQKVRLKDITDVLATSGLAERTYTIIGQGLIDKALSLRPEERRGLFEEAAGINHYKNRRAETLRRLQDTQHNLERVYDVLGEIEPRLNSLKRQATRAKNYEQVAVDLRHLLKTWYGWKWEAAKKEQRQARETAVQAEKAWQDGRQKLLVQQQNSDEARKRVNKVQSDIANARQTRDEVRELLEKARRDVAILTERQEATVRQLAEIEQDLPLQAQQQAAAQAELAAAVEELTAAQTGLQESQAKWQTFQQTFEQQQKLVSQAQNRLQQAQTKQRESQTRLAQAEGQLSQLRERWQERQKSAAHNPEAELAELATKIEQLTAVLAAAQTSINELRQKRLDVQEKRETLIREVRQLRQNARDQEQELNKKKNEVARLEARVDLLDQMRHKEVKVGANVRVLGQLAGLVTIPARYQTALEAALAARLGTLILPDEADLWRLVQETKGNVTAVALSHVQAPHHEAVAGTAVLGWANSLVTCDPSAKAAVDLLLGSILLVQTAASAYQLALDLPSGTLAVALDGFVVHAGGLVELNGRNPKDSLLGRETEWRNAREQLRDLKDDAAELEVALIRLQEQIQAQQSEIDNEQREEQRLGRLENEAGQRHSQAQRNSDQAKQQQSYLLKQQESASQEAAQLQKRLTEVEQSLSQHRQTVAEADSEVTAARAALDALPMAEATQQRQTLQQERKASQTIVAGRQAVVDSRKTTLRQIEMQGARLKERQEALLKQKEVMSLTNEQAALQKQQAKMDQLEAEIQPMLHRLNEWRQELNQWEEATAVTQRQTHDLETRYTQTKIQFTQQQSQLENLQERIKTDLGLVALSYDSDQTGPTPLPMEDIVEQLPAVSELPDDIEAQIHNYRGQLQRMGAINPDAPAEYEATQTRFDFLTQQVQDLTETEKQLRDIIRELDDLTSRAFAETVNKVNLVFGTTFTQLFGGGSAQLILTDPDDLTLSGVDILARLPNKREQGLGLLSGGERSLTAAALIFSLLKVSPTPFCVMDEVDAALDEANVNRFRDLLRELSLNTQFIVITHNRGTVQAAQTIYGISMGTDSASQCISIKPEEYLKQEALL